jgi:hypothetical protein
MLMAICGPPGSGKTTVARRVAARIDGALLRTDRVREELVPQPSYTDRETERTYEALLERARERLAADDPVVLDGTFRRRRHRDRARSLATEEGVRFELLRVTCPTPVVRERIAHREGDASDADFSTHLVIRRSFDELSAAHYTVDNAGPLVETYRQVDDLLRRIGLLDDRHQELDADLGSARARDSEPDPDSDPVARRTSSPDAPPDRDS